MSSMQTAKSQLVLLVEKKKRKISQKYRKSSL